MAAADFSAAVAMLFRLEAIDSGMLILCWLYRCIVLCAGERTDNCPCERIPLRMDKSHMQRKSHSAPFNTQYCRLSSLLFESFFLLFFDSTHLLPFPLSFVFNPSSNDKQLVFINGEVFVLFPPRFITTYRSSSLFIVRLEHAPFLSPSSPIHPFFSLNAHLP